MRKPVTMKKLGMNSALPRNSSLFFAGCSLTATLTARPARNAPTMSGRLIKSASTPATAMMASIRTK